jgi:hypothetical protein
MLREIAARQLCYCMFEEVSVVTGIQWFVDNLNKERNVDVILAITVQNMANESKDGEEYR